MDWPPIKVSVDMSASLHPVFRNSEIVRMGQGSETVPTYLLLREVN